ncbi:transposable element Tcb2 transposase [Trichonephila clavipes]|nr:transposable element Tcb2 transposase [Trichonephila clavipes]
MDVYWYGDNLMNSWTLHVNRGLFKLGGGSVMVWGVCSWHNTGSLIRLDTTLTGDRTATEWLQEHSSELRHFRWPPKPADMNIIEYILQRAIFRRDPNPLLLLLIYGQPCMFHGVNYLQHYFRH